MLKLHQLFFRTFFLVFALLLIVLSTATYYWSKSVYLDQIEKNLSQNIDSLSFALNSLDDINYIVKTFKGKTGLRITLIKEDGTVIADSDKNQNLMENHGNRFEILQAKDFGYSKTVRFSNTLNQELLYVVKKVAIDDEIYYLRLADYTKKIADNFTSLSYQIIGFIAIFLIVALLTTYRLSIKIKDETQSILDFLIELSDKKPKNEIHSEFSIEFNKITRILNTVASKLAKREKKKAKQNARLKIANRQKDEIISAISHEFKNPIAIISGYAETILNDNDMPEIMKHKFLNKIQDNSLKMSKIIDKLRFTLKLEEGKQELITSSSNVSELLKQIIPNLNDKYKDREIIINGIEKNLKVDETLFSMALENLIENALKYSDNEVIIEIKENSINIIDKGIGIDEEDLKKINDKFFRVSQNGWNNSLGLGLFIVSSILKLHKFSLEVNSEPQKGSEFIIKY